MSYYLKAAISLFQFCGLIRPRNDIQGVDQRKIDVLIISQEGDFWAIEMSERVGWSVMAGNDDHLRKVNYLGEIPSSQ